ncbi:MAG: RNA polymerase sigma factor [Egibacteraceae bacterium]
MQTGREQAEVADLVTAAAGGDSAAWDQIVERYFPLVWAVARRCGLSPADADDVSQTTLLRLFEHVGALHTPERVGSWLAVTARHESFRVLRLAGRQIPVGEQDELDVPPADVEAPEVDLRLLTAERDAELWQAFARLSLPCQQLLRMLITDPPFRYAAIAETLDMPIGSIGPTRRRCLDCLRKHLEGPQNTTPSRLLATVG